MPGRPPRNSAGRTSPGLARIGWLRELLVGLISGAVVAAGAMNGQAIIDDRRSLREERAENLRFVRERSSEGLVSRPFQALDLEGQNLSGLALAKADLARAKLRGAVLHEVDLTGASLTDADLGEVQMSGALLSGAELTSVNLSHTNLIGSNFTGANLTGADLRAAALHGADLSDVNLTLARLEGANLYDAVLDKAFLMNSQGITVCYDETTYWPDGFEPPPMNTDYCRYFHGETDVSPTSSPRQTPSP